MKFKDIDIFLSHIEEKWKKREPQSLAEGTSFVLNCLDDSIHLAEEFEYSGKDKKEMVLYIMAYLFENIIHDSLPYYIIPFEKIIRTFLIKIVFSVLVDYIVEKYNDGNWSWIKKGKL